MDILSAPGAPAAVGPYSHAVRADGFLFCSGQVGLDAEAGTLVPGGVEAEARQAFINIRAVLAAADLTLQDVVKATVFLSTMDDFSRVNAIYAEAFDGHKPARSTVAVAGLPVGALVEIEVVAVLRD
ncbi:MAG: Rid family detoxifying hydrolase [Bacteroidota bacterium]